MNTLTNNAIVEALNINSLEIVEMSNTYCIIVDNDINVEYRVEISGEVYVVDTSFEHAYGYEEEVSFEDDFKYYLPDIVGDEEIVNESYDVLHAFVNDVVYSEWKEYYVDNNTLFYKNV